MILLPMDSAVNKSMCHCDFLSLCEVNAVFPTLQSFGFTFMALLFFYIRTYFLKASKLFKWKPCISTINKSQTLITNHFIAVQVTV